MLFFIMNLKYLPDILNHVSLIKHVCVSVCVLGGWTGRWRPGQGSGVMGAGNDLKPTALLTKSVSRR